MTSTQYDQNLITSEYLIEQLASCAEASCLKLVTRTRPNIRNQILVLFISLNYTSYFKQKLLA